MVDLEKVENILSHEMLIDELERRVTALNNIKQVSSEYIDASKENQDVVEILSAELNIINEQISFLTDLIKRYRNKSS